jgi:hypothetical protein
MMNKSYAMAQARVGTVIGSLRIKYVFTEHGRIGYGCDCAACDRVNVVMRLNETKAGMCPYCASGEDRAQARKELMEMQQREQDKRNAMAEQRWKMDKQYLAIEQLFEEI